MVSKDKKELGTVPSSLEALFAVSSHVCRTPLDRATLEQALEALCKAAHLKSAVLTLLAEGGEALRILASHGIDRASGKQDLVKPCPLALWLMENEEPVVLDQPGHDERIDKASELYDVALPLVGFPVGTARGGALGTLILQPADASFDKATLLQAGSMIAALFAKGTGASARPRSTRTAETSSEAPIRGFENLVGSTQEMRRLFQQIRLVAKWTTTVLVLGESGTGKELVANAIHYNSPRAKGPFIKLNCAAVPDNLLESELFGYEKGAFTGATTQRAGRFEQAHRGTLFLDEIGEISPSFQAKLLRVLQEGEFERLGGTQTQRVDVRVVAATNRDLREAVAEKRFRQDLYYRLNVMPLSLPPLRDRVEDIDGLARHLLEKIGKAQARTLEITPSAIRILMRHDWPGNVRELENSLERAAVMSEDGLLDRDAVIRAGLPGDAAAPAPLGAPAPLSPGVPLAPAAVPPLADLTDPKLDERERLVAALEQAGWVQAKAARLLGMTPRQVAYRIQVLKIDVQKF